MKHEEIAHRYTEIISTFKATANQAHMIYGDANAKLDKELAELQAQCDHDAPPANFIDGVACPFCHKQMKEDQE